MFPVCLLLLLVAVPYEVTCAGGNSGANGAQAASGNMGRSPGMAMMMREMMSQRSVNGPMSTLPSPPRPPIIAPPNIPYRKYCWYWQPFSLFCWILYFVTTYLCLIKNYLFTIIVNIHIYSNASFYYICACFSDIIYEKWGKPVLSGGRQKH